MRRAALLLALAGCPQQQPATCQVDSDCGGEVCTRDGECLPASDVWQVKVTWTIRGMPASTTLCARSPDFYLQFDGPTRNDAFGYEPVPCQAGQFTIDKLPRRFSVVEIGVTGSFLDSTIIDPSGVATFDLYP